MKDFEKNIWKLTHRQKHAFDLAHRTEASEERENADCTGRHHQHPNGSREQVRAQQLAEKVAVDERD